MTAACPNCGATVTFRFDRAVQNTCEFCRSIVVRTGVDLRMVGKVAELPPNASPIQIRTEGRYNGQAFWVTGRIIYDWEHGSWNEWHLSMQDGTSAWLSDAQAQYAVSRRIGTPAAATQPERLEAGAAIEVSGIPMTVTSLTRAGYAGVEGELPFEYWDKTEVLFIDLRSSDNRFATFDYSDSPPLTFLGEAVEFSSLSLTNLREVRADAGPKEKAEALSCPRCGGSIDLRAKGQSVAAVCIQCLSVLDASSGTLRFIEQFHAQERIEPLIPLGKTAKLHGEVWQAIGFQVRRITVEGQNYYWHEYVLFNEFRGFRYLTQYNGHWNDVKPVTNVPSEGPGSSKIVWMNEKYKHFQTATAFTDYVMGEFPWRVHVGESAGVHDYVAPPRMLSAEKYDNEITWSIGEYVYGDDIWKAFGLSGKPPKAEGVYANQPSPHKAAMRTLWMTAIGLALLLLVSWLVTLGAAADKVVLERQYTFTPGSPGEASYVTPVFELDGRASNVEVEFDTDVNNNWVYFNLALINETTGEAWDWGREVSYYSGRDSDGNWSEGERRDRSRVGHVPAGRYYLRVEPEWSSDATGASLISLGAPSVHYTLRVKRDVPLFWPYPVALLLLLVPPIIKAFQHAAFEGSRWNESDHSGD